MSNEVTDYMKLAEALADALEKRNLWIEGEEYRELVILRMRLSNRVDSLSEELKVATARIAELEAAQRWHVVNDGDLPIVGKSIMFYDSSSKEIYRGVYTASHHWQANYFSEKRGTVTHWMPLPQPPEVQE